MMSYLKWISLAALVIGAFVVVGVNSDRADSPIVQIEQEVRPLRAVVEAKTAHRKLRRADRPMPSESWDEDALYSDSDANELKKIDIVEQASRSENLSTFLAAIKGGRLDRASPVSEGCNTVRNRRTLHLQHLPVGASGNCCGLRTDRC